MDQQAAARLLRGDVQPRHLQGDACGPQQVGRSIVLNKRTCPSKCEYMAAQVVSVTCINGRFVQFRHVEDIICKSSAESSRVGS